MLWARLWEMSNTAGPASASVFLSSQQQWLLRETFGKGTMHGCFSMKSGDQRKEGDVCMGSTKG